jgi:hypothetical protein
MKWVEQPVSAMAWDDEVAGTSDVIVQHKDVLLESLVPCTGQSLLAVEPPMMSAALAAA